MPRSAVTTRGLPRKSEKAHDGPFLLVFTARPKPGTECGFPRPEDGPVDFLRRIQNAGSRVDTLDARPIRFGCQPIVNYRSLFEMRDVCFLNIAFQAGVRARGLQANQAVRLRNRHAQINDQVFHRQAVKPVFETLQPREKFFALFRRDARALVRHIRADVPVGKHNFPRRQRRFDLRLRFQSVAGVEQRGQVRVNRVQRRQILRSDSARQVFQRTIRSAES